MTTQFPLLRDTHSIENEGVERSLAVPHDACPQQRGMRTAVRFSVLRCDDACSGTLKMLLIVKLFTI